MAQNKRDRRIPRQPKSARGKRKRERKIKLKKTLPRATRTHATDTQEQESRPRATGHGARCTLCAHARARARADPAAGRRLGVSSRRQSLFWSLVSGSGVTIPPNSVHARPPPLAHPPHAATQGHPFAPACRRPRGREASYPPAPATRAPPPARGVGVFHR